MYICMTVRYKLCEFDFNFAVLTFTLSSTALKVLDGIF